MKEWKEIENGWKVAFNNAWEAFISNTIPIGCAIMNNEILISSGCNMIYNNQKNKMPLYNNKLAHAEINAILAMKEKDQENIKKYTLYSTSEPCILCFGAISIGNIRHVKYAARDGFAGATSLNKIHGHTKSKNIIIEGPNNQLEIVQIALQSYYEIKNNPNICEKILYEFEKDNIEGVNIARKLFAKRTLDKLISKDIEYIYNQILDIM